MSHLPIHFDGTSNWEHSVIEIRMLLIYSQEVPHNLSDAAMFLNSIGQPSVKSPANYLIRILILFKLKLDYYLLISSCKNESCDQLDS